MFFRIFLIPVFISSMIFFSSISFSKEDKPVMVHEKKTVSFQSMKSCEEGIPKYIGELKQEGYTIAGEPEKIKCWTWASGSGGYEEYKVTIPYLRPSSELLEKANKKIKGLRGEIEQHKDELRACRSKLENVNDMARDIRKLLPPLDRERGTKVQGKRQ